MAGPIEGVRRRGRRGAALGVLVAAALLGAVGAPAGAGAAGPAQPVAAPVLVPLVGGDLPGATAPADAGVGAPLDPARVTRAMRPLLSGGALGPGPTPALVVDVATGEALYVARDEATIPASTMKLVTAVSVLDALGEESVLRTRTVLQATTSEIPTVLLVGGGDPSLRSTDGRVGGIGTSLSPATTAQLATRTARALAARGVEQVRVRYDASLFTGPALLPGWDGSFTASGVVAPVSALVVDQGRRTPTSVARVPDPALAAARTFADQLAAVGIRLRGTPQPAAQQPEAVALAEVASPTVAVLVERMLATSDNDYAEALARVAALAVGLPASFAGAAEHAGDVLAGLGIGSAGDRLVDASGLSRANRLTPRTLVSLLRVTSTGFGPVSSGLPVAGATGSLRARFDTPATAPARGVVRAKTGTLRGVVGLAGYASRPDGRLLAFAFVDGEVTGGTPAGREAVDRAAAALVDCACAAPAG